MVAARHKKRVTRRRVGANRGDWNPTVRVRQEPFDDSGAADEAYAAAVNVARALLESEANGPERNKGDGRE